MPDIVVYDEDYTRQLRLTHESDDQVVVTLSEVDTAENTDLFVVKEKVYMILNINELADAITAAKAVPPRG